MSTRLLKEMSKPVFLFSQKSLILVFIVAHASLFPYVLFYGSYRMCAEILDRSEPLIIIPKRRYGFYCFT